MFRPHRALHSLISPHRKAGLRQDFRRRSRPQITPTFRWGVLELYVIWTLWDRPHLPVFSAKNAHETDIGPTNSDVARGRFQLDFGGDFRLTFTAGSCR